MTPSSAQDSTLITKHKSVSPRIKSLHFSELKCKSHKEIIEICEHPVLDLMKTPYKSMCYNEWISLCASYLKIMGNFLCEIVLDDNENIQWLRPLKWEFVEVKIDRTSGEITHYLYRPPNQLPTTYEPQSVIHMKTTEVGNVVIGQGALENCINSQALYKYYDAHAISLARNYAMGGLHLNVKGQMNDKKEAERVADEFVRKFSGANVGKPIVTFAEDIDVNPLSATMRDMEFEKGRKWALKVIASCMGVPEDLLTTEDSNRASSVTAINSFLQLTIHPLLSKILFALNNELMPYYDEDLYLYFDPLESMSKDLKQQSDIINAYVSSGVMTINEARDMLGMNPLVIDVVDVVDETPSTPSESPYESVEDVQVEDDYDKGKDNY